MARRKPQEAMATRATVLEAAERCFRSQGVAQTSISSVAESSGWSRGAVYHHFDSKLELLKAVLDKGRHPLSTRLESVLANSCPIVPLLHACLCRYLDDVQNDAAIGGAFGIVTWAYDFTEDPVSIQKPLMNEVSRVLQLIKQALKIAQATGEVEAALDCAAFTELIGAILLVEVTRAVPHAPESLKVAPRRAAINLLFSILTQHPVA